ncbi:MAG: hypothetical protein JNJ54_36195 [Myxococcaceae bacterium]|nr:hypothetical protein [Myxococcaceae bacterium]
MTRRDACPRSAVHGMVWAVVMMGVVAGCADSGPRLQLQVPKSPRSSSAALGSSTTPSVPANATFDAPVIDPNTWSGTPIGTGSFTVALSPSISGAPSSIAFTDPQAGDRFVFIGDFSAPTGTALALISDTAWVVGTTTLNGSSKTAVVFDPSTGNVTAVASAGTVTLTAAGSALGQRVTGTLSASFVPSTSAPPQCVVDADCASQERCQSGQCVRVTPAGCTSNAQCAPGQVCQSGACIAAPPQDAGPAPACVIDADCAVSERCLSGQCVAVTTGCTSSAQCARGEQCVAGQCVASPAGCTSSAQCASGQQCVAGQCVSSPSGCTSNAQCPRGLVCQAGQCVSTGPASCTPKQGSGGYSGSFGAVNTCSALGSGAVSLTNAVAALDDDQGQLALFIVDPNTQRDGLIVELNACPSGPGSATGLSATLYSTSQTTGGVVLSAMVPGTASIQWTQVGATIGGSVSVSFGAGGTVTGTFTVQ